MHRDFRRPMAEMLTSSLLSNDASWLGTRFSGLAHWFDDLTCLQTYLQPNFLRPFIQVVSFGSNVNACSSCRNQGGYGTCNLHRKETRCYASAHAENWVCIWQQQETQKTEKSKPIQACTTGGYWSVSKLNFHCTNHKSSGRNCKSLRRNNAV